MISDEFAITSRKVYAEVIGPPTATDPYAAFEVWRRETPTRAGDVMAELNGKTTTPAGDQPKFSLLRYDDVSGALRDAKTFSNDVYFDLLDYVVMDSKPTVAMEAASEEHRLWRGLFTSLFSRKAILAWEKEIFDPVAQRLAREMASHKRGDLVDYAMQFPMHMIYGLIGVNDVDGVEFEWFREQGLAAAAGFAIGPDPERTRANREGSAKALREIGETLMPVIKRKRAEGATANDLISRMIAADMGVADEVIADFAGRAVPTATENTWRQFLNMMTCLLERPDLVDAVREDRSLVPQAVAEGERYESAVMSIPRNTTTELELNGTTIPAGAFVTLVLGSGNRDPEAYPDPDTFDIYRQGPHALTFGFGAHICPGLNVARYEMKAALNALLDHLPNLRLDPDQEPPRIDGAVFRGPHSLHVAWD